MDNDNNNNNSADINATATTSTSRKNSNSQSISERNTQLFKEVEAKIASGEYTYRTKTFGSDGKRIRSKCWEVICEVVDCEDNIVPNFFVCKLCKNIIQNTYKQGSTNKLNRHECKRNMPILISKFDKDKLKFAAAKFIADDLRPYHAVECDGFKALCYELMQFGQRHKHATMQHLQAVLPCRNIRYAMSDEEILQFLCYCHLINNLVCKMLQIEDVKNIISKASELVKYVKTAGLCAQLETTLKAHCSTRWNSVFVMFDSIIKNYLKILQILGDKQAAQAQVGRSSSSSSSSSQKAPLEYVCNLDMDALENYQVFKAF